MLYVPDDGAETGGIIMIIALDGMGGDNAPEEIIKGALKSVEAFDDIHIHIFGDEKAIAPYLTEHNRLTVIHC
ncbi:hypothetical protein J4G37_57515, partial [Microvirga sp. 3-52]|nr:hypothetical protein [Microvirga sp. 3-52]